MGKNDEFLIPFKGLANGMYEYRFQLKADFFTNFENTQITSGQFDVRLSFEKRDRMIVLDFDFEGDYRAGCDRCLAEIDIPLDGNDRIIAKVQSEASEIEEDNVVIMSDDQHILDVSNMIFDAIHLHMPLKNERDCEADGFVYCDHDVLDKLDSAQDDNDDSDTWDILRKLSID